MNQMTEKPRDIFVAIFFILIYKYDFSSFKFRPIVIDATRKSLDYID